MKLISNLFHKCSQGVTFPPLPYTFLSPVIEEREERLTEKRDMSALFTGGAIIRKKCLQATLKLGNLRVCSFFPKYHTVVI